MHCNVSKQFQIQNNFLKLTSMLFTYSVACFDFHSMEDSLFSFHQSTVNRFPSENKALESNVLSHLMPENAALIMTAIIPPLDLCHCKF